MDVLEAIRSRRSIFRFKPGPVPRDVIERIFEYGTWAPSHHMTEPWRFTVIGEQAKETLARRYAQMRMAQAPDHVDAENRKKIGEANYGKFMSKPTIVAVSYVQEGDAQQRREDYASACCAVQNVALAAWQEGVGMQWSTGPITREADTYTLLGIDPDREEIIGFFYTGYPAEVPAQKRKPLCEVLRWTM